MKRPAYKELEETIRTRINKGVYPLGSQLPTEMDLVNEFQLSRMTVSKGLTALIEDQVIKRIRGKGTFVCSQKLTQAQVGHEISVVKCLFPGTIAEQPIAGNPVLQAICRELKNSGYQTGIAYYGSCEEAVELLSDRNNPGCAGYVIWPSCSENFRNAVENLRRKHKKVVLLDNLFPDFEGDFIGTDSLAGAQIAVDHLIAMGHQRIAYLSPTPRYTSLADRLSGYLSAMSRHDLAINWQHIGIVNDDSNMLPEWNLEKHRAFLRQWLPQLWKQPKGQRPTAFFASNDSLAYLIFDQLNAMGLNVPGDVSIVGFDNLDRSQWLPVPLTSIEHDLDGIGRLAAKRLLTGSALEPLEPARYYLRPKLITRKSVSALNH